MTTLHHAPGGRILYLVMGKVGRQKRGIPVQDILQQLRGEGKRVT